MAEKEHGRRKTERNARPRLGRHGLTLVEMLIALALVAMVMSGIAAAIATVLEGARSADSAGSLRAEARAALARMVRCVEETDRIASPATAVPVEILSVAERAMDTYSNGVWAYAAAGDGWLDADNDSDGFLNEEPGGADDVEWIQYLIDRAAPARWKLVERRPSYAPAAMALPADSVLSDAVAEFSCRQALPGLVEITLTLRRGDDAVSLTTRARSRHIR